MSDFNSTTDYSLVSIILPKLTGEAVVQSLGKNGAKHIIQSTSRGSLLNEGGGFFSKMFPRQRQNKSSSSFLFPHLSLAIL